MEGSSVLAATLINTFFVIRKGKGLCFTCKGRKNRLIMGKEKWQKAGRVSDFERQREGQRPFDVRLVLAPLRVAPLLFRCPHLKRG